MLIYCRNPDASQDFIWISLLHPISETGFLKYRNWDVYLDHIWYPLRINNQYVCCLKISTFTFTNQGEFQVVT